MLDLRPVLYATGALGALLAIAMLLPALVDLASGGQEWSKFTVSSFFVLAICGMLMISNKGASRELTSKQAFVMITLVWILLPFFGSLPLIFSEYNLSLTDAYFEAMSGLTTTGSTVLSGLDDYSPGILLWRAILQWLGGFGVVVMAIAILPLLQIGGMQLFRIESGDTNEKILPRAGQISVAITGLYIAFTALCALLLMSAGLSAFDAVTHAMTTIATGGFSTHDASIGYFDSSYVDAVIIAFMIVGSLPFVLYFQALRGRPLALWQDEQARIFLLCVSTIITLVVLWLIIFKGFTFAEAFRYGGFNLISIMTGTGFASTDYGQWGAFSVSLFFLAMFIGGCTGSTSCGIKIFRFIVLFKSLGAWKEKLITPNGIFIPRFNGRRIGEDVQSSVLSFFAFFILSILTLAFFLSLTGLDWVTSLSGAGTAIANVGPGLGDIIGPAGNFESLPSSAKWLLSFGMLIGRLELFAVFVLFTPGFWRA